MIKRSLIDRFCLWERFHLHGTQYSCKPKFKCDPWAVSIDLSVCHTKSYNFPTGKFWKFHLLISFNLGARGLAIIPTVFNFKYSIDFFILDCFNADLICCQVSITENATEHIKDLMKLFSKAKEGRNKFSIFKELLSKYRLASTIDFRVKPTPIFEKGMDCINQISPKILSTEVKVHFVYITKHSDARRIDFNALDYGLWSSVIVCPLEWNYCVAGFLRNISIERCERSDIIHFKERNEETKEKNKRTFPRRKNSIEKPLNKLSKKQRLL